ncbi:unnamed protein product [[Candida] boidinii]|nr:unnamed protein product [[Candida] boidinii]
MKAELNKEDNNSNKFSKGQLLLRIIGSFILFTKAYLDILKKNNWAVDIDHNERHQLTSSNIDSSLKIILYILNFSTVFTIHEDIANEFPNRDTLKSKSSESFLMFKNLSVLVLTVLCYFYYQKLKLKNSNCDVMPESYYENLNDFLSICHEQLGIRRLCGLSDGIFLDFIEAKLVELEWPESDKDIMQCINCRYGIDVAIDSWFPLDHKAPETDLTKLSAVRLSHYILSYCFRKKHPVLKLPTNDIKTLIEYIYEVLGDPDSNNEIIFRNYSSIEMFLNTKSLDVRTMKFAFYGLLNVDLEIPALEFRRSIDEGLYYLQALVGFSAFKTKKRNMQSRVADLDSVIALLKSDIACGSNRLESWLLLGQAYSAFVEDDMIWTADKLNNPEKKNITAFMQKQALLCYLKAIDIYAHMSNDQKENLRLVAASLWLTFGNELYNALKEPMSKLAFMVNSVPIYVKKNGQKTYEAVSNNPITAEAIYKILRIAFLMSAKLNSNSWSSLYYLSKIDSKDETDVDSVFEILLKSCSLVPKITSRDDPVLEPHYS